MRRPDPRFSRPLLIGLLVAILPSPALAGGSSNVIAVTTTDDAMDPFDQLCSLREALANANSNMAFSLVVNECPAGVGTTTDTIQLQSGATYSLTLVGAGDAAGDLDVLDDPDLPGGIVDLRIETVGGDTEATISQSLNTERVVEIHSADTVFTNIVIRDGALGSGGGGIYNGGGAMVLKGVSLIANVASSGGGLYNDGFATLIDSQVVLNEASLIFGGGIFNGSGTMLLSNSMVRGNKAVIGGGIYNDGTLSIKAASTISLNSATDDGGGIANDTASSLKVQDSSFLNNTAGVRGGAVYVALEGTMVSSDSDYSGNQAVEGGAIRMFSINELAIVGGRFLENSASANGGAINAPHLRLTKVALKGNTAGQDGGAVFAEGLAYIDDSVLQQNFATGEGGAVHAQFLTSSGSQFTGNTAAQRGGAAYVFNRAEITAGGFSHNSASEGGGLWLDSATNKNSFILRSVFHDNLAQFDGGAVWTDADDLTITNTTISGNIAVNGSGSGLYIDDDGVVIATNVTLADNAPGENLAKYGELRLKNSIITSPGEIDCVVALDNPEIDSLGNNLSDDNSCIGLDEVTDQTEVDVLLAPLANNGGNTRTHALLAGSPALNAGDGAACDAAPVEGMDQRGGLRPPGFGCDIGAHEQEAEVSQVIFADGFESL